MDIVVDVRASDVLRMLREGRRRQTWAIANALNATAKDAQAAIKKHVAEKFVVRKTEFIMREAAIIKPFADARTNQLSVTISVGRKEGMLLPEYEAGAARRPQAPLVALGEPSVGVPVVGGPARPTIQSVVPQSQWLGRLGLQHVGKSVVASGGRRAIFLTPGKAVRERVAGMIRTLYVLLTREVRLPPSLEFVETARRASASFPGHLEAQIADSFAHVGVQRPESMTPRIT